MSLYITLSDINPLQTQIMGVVDVWVRTQKTPVPKTEILLKLGLQGEKSFTILNALQALTRKGYLRKANMASTNKTHYVQLRSPKF